MKLATLMTPAGPRAAALTGAGAVTVDGYADVGALLAAGERGPAAASAAAAGGGAAAYADADLRMPVARPGAVVCVGLNFRSHILEMGRELPQAPTLFAKLPSALTDPSADVALPAASPAVDYEGELVVVVGREARNVPAEEAHEYVAGYTLMNDVSMRDWQARTIQWFAGKNFERSTPVGPVVVTPDALDLGTAELVVSVNGEVRQRAALADLVFGPSELVADLSRITTLRPGDLIATGTPGGVGHARDPKTYLAHGDVVSVAVDGVGTLTTRFHAA